MSHRLAIKITRGETDAETVAMALSVAAASVAGGVPTALWLAGDAAWFAVPDRIERLSVPHADPTQSMSTVLQFGEVYLCTPCALRRGIGEDSIRPGIALAGAATFVEQVVHPDVQALIY